MHYIYMCVCVCVCLCISFWFISFYLWLVLVFLFSRISYGFTPLRHCMSRHYTSWQLSKFIFYSSIDMDVEHPCFISFLCYIYINFSCSTFLFLLICHHCQKSSKNQDYKVAFASLNIILSKNVCPKPCYWTKTTSFHWSSSKNMLWFWWDAFKNIVS